MIYAYIRVSTEMQTYENQKFEIQKYCDAHHIKVDKWCSESISGTIAAEKRALGRIIGGYVRKFQDLAEICL